MRIDRLYIAAGNDPFEGVKFRVEKAEDLQDYTVPLHWSRAAVDVLMEKVFHKESLPALTRKVKEDGIPEWLWRSEADDQGLDNISAEWRFRREHDIRDVLKRVAGGLAYRACKDGLLTPDDARAFHDELIYLMIHQMGVLEVSLLANAGLDWAYGIKTQDYIPRQRISGFKDGAEGGVTIPLRAEYKNIFRRIALLGEAAALSGEERKISVMLPVENAESEKFVGMKRDEDIRAASAELGRKMLTQAVLHVMDATERGSLRGFDPQHNQTLADAVEFAKQAGVTENFINLAIDYARQGYEDISLASPFDAEPSRLSTALSVPDTFIESALTGHGFMIYEGEKPLRHISASKLFDKVAENIWQTGEPGLFFRDSVVAAAPFIAETAPVGQSVSGGYIFSSDTTAPSASINLAMFDDPQGLLKTGALRHAARVLAVALDAASDFGSYRSFCLGVTNISALLMSHALPYDSDEGRAAAALAAGLVSAAAYQASADMAATAGAFRQYAAIEKNYLQALKDKISHVSGSGWMQRGIARKTAQVNTAFFPALAQEVRQVFESAYQQGKEKGFRNAHVSALDTDVDMQALLAAQTKDIFPEKALVRFEGYYAGEASEIYGKKLNPCVPRALSKMGYSPSECDDIHFYAVGHGTLFDAPHINHIILKRHGFHKAAIDALEAALRTAHHIRYVFNKWTLGEDFCRHMLGFTARQIDDASFDMLSALGFSEDEIEEANLYCCGAMTLEGAPHLEPAHIAVFDCIAQPTPLCVRSVSPEAQVKMQAAIEPFLSGAVAHTIELDHYSSIDRVQKLLLLGWEQGVKHLRIYRHGSSLLHPVVLPAAATKKVADSPQDDEEALSEEAAVA